jgi:hypothetical protein
MLVAPLRAHGSDAVGGSVPTVPEEPRRNPWSRRARTVVANGLWGCRLSGSNRRGVDVLLHEKADRWTGVTKPGTVSEHVWAFWGFLPTACDLAGVEVPPGLDGISLAPTITGKENQKSHEFLYWEFHEGATAQAVRHGDWKAIRSAPGRPLELYNLAKDQGEKRDVAAENPEVVARIEAYLKTARTESKEFPVTGGRERPR